MEESIPVTKTFLPPIEEYMAHIQRAYDNSWLTNRGELVLELESKLTDFLGLVDTKMLCMNNGTIPLQIAIKLLGNGGEIITTPFSYVATTAAIVWENCTPVFVDINPDFLTIDETKIEDAINEKTTCILATHVFGNPCNIDEIQRIADKYDLKVIYDAAHCFGVKYKEKSIFEYGDVSTCSFHATKLFQTGEGGALFTNNKALFHESYYSHNFGHNGPLKFHGLGINGKLSELQSAMGLAMLPYLDKILVGRKHIISLYEKLLSKEKYNLFKTRAYTTWNYSYYPIIFENEQKLTEIEKKLNDKFIFPRRYFYPSLHKLPYLKNENLPMVEKISKRILCLPLYIGLSDQNVDKICNILNEKDNCN